MITIVAHFRSEVVIFIFYGRISGQMRIDEWTWRCNIDTVPRCIFGMVGVQG
jgi:hypothetical protein